MIYCFVQINIQWKFSTKKSITLIPNKVYFENVIQFVLEYDADVLLELAQLINYNPCFVYDQWATNEIFHADYIINQYFYCIVP